MIAVWAAQLLRWCVNCCEKLPITGRITGHLDFFINCPDYKGSRQELSAKRLFPRWNSVRGTLLGHCAGSLGVRLGVLQSREAWSCRRNLGGICASLLQGGARLRALLPTISGGHSLASSTCAMQALPVQCSTEIRQIGMRYIHHLMYVPPMYVPQTWCACNSLKTLFTRHMA